MLPKTDHNLKQLDSSGSSLLNGWRKIKPKFYGIDVTEGLYEKLINAEDILRCSESQNISPELCRALSSFHGYKGAKVPLNNITVTGCVRPYFINLNKSVISSSSSCYNGHCYVFHARSIPGKKSMSPRVYAHRVDEGNLLESAKIAQHLRISLRDNQTSDGSLSMALFDEKKKRFLLDYNLEMLAENGFEEVPYLCFSAAYTKVSNSVLKILSKYKSLTVHVTVSGWHSKEENNLRLNEFERYSKYIKNVWLRVVNRQDWAGVGEKVDDSGAAVECWLMDQIERRKLLSKVIRTPFHSVSPFPGSKVDCLGSRHMAGDDYVDYWEKVKEQGGMVCCTTGKCKTCSIRCGVSGQKSEFNPLIAGNAYCSMLRFELSRQKDKGVSPLGDYVTRLIAKKAYELFKEMDGYIDIKDEMKKIINRLNIKLKDMDLSTLERRRLVNDSHALVNDGIDRHKLWVN